MVVKGHRVASGQNRNSLYPRGTIEAQKPFFRERGLDLSALYAATLNVSIAPRAFKLLKPAYTFTDIEWAPRQPPENFSFSPCSVIFNDRTYDGYVYYPHPDTKPRHHQPAGVLEIIAPRISGLAYGASVVLVLNPDEVSIRE